MFKICGLRVYSHDAIIFKYIVPKLELMFSIGMELSWNVVVYLSINAEGFPTLFKKVQDIVCVISSSAEVI